MRRRRKSKRPIMAASYLIYTKRVREAKRTVKKREASHDDEGNQS
jgi:hypothetical protein